MALGGANVGWDESVPADTDDLGLGDDVIRSLKSSLRNGLGSEHNWPSVGGANTGYHLLGSGRPFYGLQSAVSSTGTDGRLMLTSDTSQLFAVGSAGTVLLGGQNVISMGTTPGTLPQRHQWVEVAGAGVAIAGVVVANFSSFSGIPYVTASAYTTSSRPIICTITALTAGSATIESWTTFGTQVSGHTVMWRSLGTRVL